MPKTALKPMRRLNTILPPQVREKAQKTGFEIPATRPNIVLDSFNQMPKFHSFYSSNLDSILAPLTDTPGHSTNKLSQILANSDQTTNEHINAQVAINSLNTLYGTSNTGINGEYQKIQADFNNKVDRLINNNSSEFGDRNKWSLNRKTKLLNNLCEEHVEALEKVQRKELEAVATWFEDDKNQEAISKAYGKNQRDIDFNVLQEKHLEQLKKRQADEKKQLEDLYAQETTRIIQAETNYIQGQLVLYFHEFLPEQAGVAVRNLPTGADHNQLIQAQFNDLKKFMEDNGYIPTDKAGNPKMILNENGSIGFTLKGNEEEVRAQVQDIISAVRLKRSIDGKPDDKITFDFNLYEHKEFNNERHRTDKEDMLRLIYEECVRAGYNPPHGIEVKGFTPTNDFMDHSLALRQEDLYEGIEEPTVRDIFKSHVQAYTDKTSWNKLFRWRKDYQTHTGDISNKILKLDEEDIQNINDNLDYSRIKTPTDLEQQLNFILADKYGPNAARKLKISSLDLEKEEINSIRSFTIKNKYLREVFANAYCPDGTSALDYLARDPNKIFLLNQMATNPNMTYDQVIDLIKSICEPDFIDNLRFKGLFGKKNETAEDNNFKAQFCKGFFRKDADKAAKFHEEQIAQRENFFKKATSNTFYQYAKSNRTEVAEVGTACNTLQGNINTFDTRHALPPGATPVQQEANKEARITETKNILSNYERLLAKVEAQTNALNEFEKKADWRRLPDDDSRKKQLFNEYNAMREENDRARQDLHAMHNHMFDNSQRGSPFKMGSEDLNIPELVERANGLIQRISRLATQTTPRPTF